MQNRMLLLQKLISEIATLVVLIARLFAGCSRDLQNTNGRFNVHSLILLSSPHTYLCQEKRLYVYLYIMTLLLYLTL